MVIRNVWLVGHGTPGELGEEWEDGRDHSVMNTTISACTVLMSCLGGLVG